MKTQDIISRRILSVSVGISLVLLSASALVLSFHRATASSTGIREELDKAASELSEGQGNYMMQYEAFSYESGDEAYNVLVWNPHTGKSRIYYYDTDEKRMIHWTGGDLPADPLGN